MNVTGTKRVVGPLSPPPSAYTEDVVFAHDGEGVELRCTYERNGSMFSGGLLFSKVRAYQFRAESHCTSWHVDEAYDTLVEIDGSRWIAELLGAKAVDGRGQWAMRHFLIYLDGVGAYEVAAEGVEWLKETKTS
jgi:hypothetical protein